MNILALLAGAFVLSVIVRALFKKSAVFTAPRRIQLFRATPTGKHANDLTACKRELDECEMKGIGTYRIDPLNTVATAFVNERESICAVVYRHPVVGCFVDVISKSTTGSSFTASNAPLAAALDQQEGHEKTFDKGLSIPAMFELVKERRPAGPWETWNEENFARKFEAAYAEEMDWRARRGGVTADEVRRQAKASGENYSEEVIHEATRKLQEQFAESRRNR
jgi:hypothetical protein